ncbi:hypothetical protein PHMEG_00034875 [Phytophthora megakarya]|uniref:Uncharacterized protein n=1 Tax=Phytophthora megakarya TaxID=4795 RepID=A0A225UQ48_9STRA|nr:hypothetical protein PHMEG_00034875 [Phytophthora megakarya]
MSRLQLEVIIPGGVNGLCDPSTEISSKEHCLIAMAVLVYWVCNRQSDVRHRCSDCGQCVRRMRLQTIWCSVSYST